MTGESMNTAEGDSARPLGSMTQRAEVLERVAQRIADAYGAQPKLLAAAVAGSVGTGLSDRWSDLEIDCYWEDPPTPDDRKAPIARLGAELTTLWEYDEDDREWSEDYVLDGVPVTVSNFRAATIEEFLEAVVERHDLDRAKHFRLAALRRSRPLRGEALLSGWRRRAMAYPDALVRAVLDQSFRYGGIPGWSARAALVERDDVIAVRTLLASVAERVFRATLAINRIYCPHGLAKWQHALLDECRMLPNDFASSLDGMWGPVPRVALSHAEALLIATLDLAEEELGLTLSTVRDELGEHRTPHGADTAGISRPR